MSLVLPYLPSSTDNLSSYCNYIEYSCFRDGNMLFSEFDVNGTGLKLKDIIQELNRRLELYGQEFIPFKIEKDRILSMLSDKEVNLHYFYCLYFAVKGGNNKTAHTNIFEQITDNSLRNYFGTDYSIVTSIGQNSVNLKNAIEKIKDALLEKKGSYEEMPKKAKDGGIDIITYKPVDNRGNQVVCLTDATVGRHWQSEKRVLNKLDYWVKYIHFKLRPLTCLSIVHIVEDSDFFSASTDNGLMFDRARIMRYYKGDSSITSTLKTWLGGL